ncbi:uncharacterized protein MAM_05640 [Metarhizium album ARSEF 1941]|uniref:Uncharacterized protein n=1 Tax=Metarhizium album (strain ARSEF 1941) TaxID=1081103 RepID=A0A0B2WJY1_METAS|nr:uncharacterized protein MAM_05640 [Metarhizium album ARSEF 1941]KHN96351.1 hypothetical protein MAM_05640 [Metarhizium album ARSEF 1941]
MHFIKRNPDNKSHRTSFATYPRYVRMLLRLDQVPFLHNAFAAFFVWLLLAGFLFFPGTFTSIRKSIENKNTNTIGDQATELFVKSVKNIPLLVIAAMACAISVVGMVFLAWKHRDNYVWLQNKLVIPGVANCLAGLISTLVGVYSQQKGVWSPTAKITAIVEGSCLGIAAGLFLIVERLLRRVREENTTHYKNSSLR